MAAVVDRLATLVEHARARCELGVRIRLAGQSVAFWSDASGGTEIAHTIFGPYCAVEPISTPDRGRDWWVGTLEIPDLAALTERLVAGGTGPPAPVRRWAGDLPADRHDVTAGSSFVVHRQPFSGVTLFLRDERVILYLRPDRTCDVPHTEHVIKYPLRVMLRQAGCSQVHAAACSWRGRGLLLMGPRRSGKSTLLMQLLNRGARFVSSDFAMIGRSPDGGFRMIAFPHMLRVAHGTIGDNERLRASLSRLERTGDYLRSPVFNAGKEEFYAPVLRRVWGEVICQQAPLDVILFPALDLAAPAAASTLLPRREVVRRMLSTLIDDPPTLDWLPFMSDVDYHRLARTSAAAMARGAPDAYELRFGTVRTDPVGAVERLIDALDRAG